MKTAFVTGAYGMLGSWLTKALLDRGARVVVLKRDLEAGSALTIEGTEERCHVVHGDVLDAALLERVVEEEEVDTVFHLAAQTIVGAANRSPVSTFESNIRGTWNLMEACRLRGRRARWSWRRRTRPTARTRTCPTARATRSRRCTPTTCPKPRPI